MKKALILLIFVSFQLSAISVRELIDPALGGHQPPIVNRRLDLSNKNIDNLDGLELLEDPLAITGLNLTDNQLTTLPPGIFNTLVNLNALYLEKNKLIALPSGIFITLDRLGMLTLDHNQLTTLPAGIFDHLDNLKLLNLSDNQLTTLQPGIFDDLSNLKWLILDNNKLSTLPEGIFDNLRNLTISLNGNQFQQTTQQFRAKYLANRNNIDLLFKTPEQETAMVYGPRWQRRQAQITKPPSLEEEPQPSTSGKKRKEPSPEEEPQPSTSSKKEKTS